MVVRVTRTVRWASVARVTLCAALAAGCGSSEEGSTPGASLAASERAEAPARDTDGREMPQAETAQPEAAQPEPARPEAAEEAARPARPRRRLSPADARTYRAEIAAARREARAGADRGLAAFERLIAAHPTDPRLHCEAGLLAHRAGRAEDASRLLAAGVRLFGDLYAVPAALRAPVAMCLYNRGLVHEAAGHVASARDAYRASLRLRAHDAVERRLAALPPVEPPPIVEAASIDALIERLIAEADEAGGEDFRGEPLEWVLQIGVMAHRPPADGAPDLALLQLSENEDLTITQRVVLAVQVGAGYRLFPLLDDIDDMTDHGNTDMVSLGDGAIEVITTPAGPVVRASFTHGHISGVDACDDECCYGWSSESAETVLGLCALGEAIDCQALTTTLHVTPSGGYSDCDDGQPAEPPTRWERALTIDADGTAHLRVVSGRPPEPPAPGDRPFVTLLRLVAEDR